MYTRGGTMVEHFQVDTGCGQVVLLAEYRVRKGWNK